MNSFTDKYKDFLKEFGESRTMVLSTSKKDIVSSRMMSIINLKGKFYFQTDNKLKKYNILKHNPNVALCIDNIQIEGLCVEEGHPLDNEDFCFIFQKNYKGSYDAYSSLENERLFSVKPLFIERWKYINSQPYLESFDVLNEKYNCQKYIG